MYQDIPWLVGHHWTHAIIPVCLFLQISLCIEGHHLLDLGILFQDDPILNLCAKMLFPNKATFIHSQGKDLNTSTEGKKFNPQYHLFVFVRIFYIKFHGTEN